MPTEPARSLASSSLMSGRNLLLKSSSSFIWMEKFGGAFSVGGGGGGGGGGGEGIEGGGVGSIFLFLENSLLKKFIR